MFEKILRLVNYPNPLLSLVIPNQWVSSDQTFDTMLLRNVIKNLRSRGSERMN